MDVPVRVANINRQLGQIFNTQAKEFLNTFGVRVEETTNDVRIGVRYAPTVEYGGNAIVQVAGVSARFRQVSMIALVV